LDVRELRYFTQVARAGSFSKAAAELYVAQPALSRQIRKLEEELGVELLVRYGRGVRLTTAGAMLLERAEMIAHFLKQTAEDVRQGGGAVTGHLSLGVPPAAGLLLGRQVVEAFRARWPHVSLHIREGLSSSLQEWVLDGRVDIAVLHNPPPLESLDIERVLSEPMVVVGPPRPPAGAGKAPFRLDSLSELPLILPGLPHSNRRLMEQAAVQRGLRLRVVLEVDSVELTKSLVAQGLGYTILTFAAVQNEVARGELSVHPIERPAIRSTVAIASLRESRASPLVGAMKAILRDNMQSLVISGEWQGSPLWLADPGNAVEKNAGTVEAVVSHGS
jgi:LysR family nitrogen assimilation transcriptional regulator